MDTPQPLSFSDFLEKMKDPAAADLVRNIKSFIKQFEDRPKGHPVDPDADSRKVQDFMAKSEQLFRAHPVWRGSLPAVLDQAVEGLEKYVMSKIWRETFGVSQEDRDRDERYARLSRALAAFVDLPTLMGVEGVAPDPALLAMAQGELLKMDKYKAPRDKLLCLVNVKTMVENIVQQEAKKGAKIGGADAFFPVFLFIVIRSCLPRLASNVEHIKRFRTLSRLTGQFDFMLCNLESAAMYLDTVNYEHLRISQHEFLARLAEAGIPEADLELRRLQRQRAQQEAAAAAAVEAGGAGEGSPRSGLSSPRALDTYLRHQEEQIHHQHHQQQQERQQGSAGGSGGESTARAGAAQEAAADGPLDGSQPQQQEQSPGGGIAFSLPSTPAGLAAANVVDIHASTATQQCSLNAAAARGMGAAAAGPPAVTTNLSPAETEGGLSPLPLGTPGGVTGAAGGLAGGLSLTDTLRRQLFEEAEGPAVASAAELAAAESSFIEEVVADGAQWVLHQEARGLLQRKYPYMYASAADLTVGDVQQVLAGYKDLILRYEALALSLRRQLGPATGGAAAGASQTQQGQGRGGSGAFLGAQRGTSFPDFAEGPLPLGASAATGLAISERASDEAAAATAALLGPGSSPSRRSLLQRITSRGPRSSSKGEVAAAGPAAAGPARSPLRISPTGSPLSSKWRVAEGSGGLLSSLFGTPQRQGGRRSQDGNRKGGGSRVEEGTVQLRPLPLPAVMATVTLAPSSPPNVTPRSSSSSQPAERAASLEAAPSFTLTYSGGAGTAPARLASTEEGDPVGLPWGLHASESEEHPRGPLSRGGSAPDGWEEEQRPAPSELASPAAAIAAAAASSLGAGGSESGLGSSSASMSASLGGYAAMLQEGLGELGGAEAAERGAAAVGEGREAGEGLVDETPAAGEGRLLQGLAVASTAAADEGAEEVDEGLAVGSAAAAKEGAVEGLAGGSAAREEEAGDPGAAATPPADQQEESVPLVGLAEAEGEAEAAATPSEPVQAADIEDVLAGLQLSEAADEQLPAPVSAPGEQLQGRQGLGQGGQQAHPAAKTPPIPSAGSFWHREMMDAATDSPRSHS